jgi:hypothetical protein
MPNPLWNHKYFDHEIVVYNKVICQYAAIKYLSDAHKAQMATANEVKKYYRCK